MIKQVVYNYIDAAGNKWNTNGSSVIKGESTIDPSQNLFNFAVGEEVKRFSLQALPGTFFNFGGVNIIIGNSGIFNYDGKTTSSILFDRNNLPNWFILDYEIGEKGEG